MKSVGLVRGGLGGVPRQLLEDPRRRCARRPWPWVKWRQPRTGDPRGLYGGGSERSGSGRSLSRFVKDRRLRWWRRSRGDRASTFCAAGESWPCRRRMASWMRRWKERSTEVSDGKGTGLGTRLARPGCCRRPWFGGAATPWPAGGGLATPCLPSGGGAGPAACGCPPPTPAKAKACAKGGACGGMFSPCAERGSRSAGSTPTMFWPGIGGGILSTSLGVEGVPLLPRPAWR